MKKILLLLAFLLLGFSPALAQVVPPTDIIQPLSPERLMFVNDVIEKHGHPELVAVRGMEIAKQVQDQPAIFDVKWDLLCSKQNTPGLFRVKVSVRLGPGREFQVKKISMQ